MWKNPGNLTLAAFAVMGVFVFAAPANAETLYESLQALVKNQKQIKAKEAELKAAKERAEAAWGDWYPELSVTANWGREKQNKASGTADTEEHPREVDISITQQLWDFGESNAAIRRARLALDRANVELALTRQALTLQGIEAHLNLIRANKILGFAKGSVANIRRQAKLEDARVQRGGGFTTDVLQAKTQLAGAEARRNNFAADLRTAINVYRRFFGRDPGKIGDMKEPRVPFELLPKTLDKVIQVTFQDNPGLESSRLLATISRETVDETRAKEMFPSINAVAETKRKEDVGGTIDKSTEQLFKVELTYKLNLGLTGLNTIRATEQDYLSLSTTHADDRDAAEQDARNLWSDLERNRSNAGFLKNQADIAAEFLELARRERQLGNRSLIDVLAGETALINANSDAVAAETDIATSVFRLLTLMGKMKADVVK